MKNRGENKRLKIFEEFSKNFSTVFDSNQLRRIDNEFYICPLCYRSFHKEDLSQTLENPLTIEDVPPKKLNGKQILLTCKKCNNINGSVYDSHLSKWFKAFSALESEGDLDFKMSVDSSNKFKTKLTRDKEKRRIDITSNPKNPYAKKNVTNMQGKEKSQVQFIFDFGDEKKINDGLLRFAYLYAFYYFGYSYIFSPGGKYINEYLTFNKHKELKPLIKSENLNQLEEGVYKILSPSHIGLFFVILKLGYSVHKNVGIILPGPIEEHLGNFKLLNKENIGSVQFQKVIKPDINIYPFVCYQVWN